MTIISSFKNLTKFERNLFILSSSSIFLSFVLVGSINILIMIASLVGVFALTFVAKGDVLGLYLTVLFSILYSIISFRFRYFGEMITYLGMTLPISCLSIITWLKNKESEKEVKIGRLNYKICIFLFLSCLLVTYIFYFILVYFDTHNILFSTISISTSFLAVSFVVFRSPYYAIFYALNDLVLIILWVLATLENIIYLPMIVCFSVFFINDTYGFFNWKKMELSQLS